MPHTHGSSSSSSPLSHQSMHQTLSFPDSGTAKPEPRMGQSRSGKQLKPQISQGSLLKQAIANRLNPHMFKQNELPKPMAVTNALDDDDRRKWERNADDTERPSSPEGSASLESVKSGNATRDEDRDSLLSNPAWYRANDGGTGVKEKNREKNRDETNERAPVHLSTKKLTKISKDGRSDTIVDEVDDKRERQPNNGRKGADLLNSANSIKANERHFSRDSIVNERFTAARQESAKNEEKIRQSGGRQRAETELNNPVFNQNASDASLHKEASFTSDKEKIYGSRGLASVTSDDHVVSENSSGVHQIDLGHNIFGGGYLSSSVLLRQPSDLADDRSSSNQQENFTQRQASLRSVRRERSRGRGPPDGLGDSSVSLPVYTSSGSGLSKAARNHDSSRSSSVIQSRDKTDQVGKSESTARDSIYHGDEFSNRSDQTGEQSAPTHSSPKSREALIIGQADYQSRNKMDEKRAADSSESLSKTDKRSPFSSNLNESRDDEQRLGDRQNVGRSTISLKKTAHSNDHRSATAVHQVQDCDSEEYDSRNVPRSEGMYAMETEESMEHLRAESRAVNNGEGGVSLASDRSRQLLGSAHELINKEWSRAQHQHWDRDENQEGFEGLEGHQHLPIDSLQSVYQEDIFGPDHFMHGDVEEYANADDLNAYFSMDQLPDSVRRAIEMDIRRGWAREADAMPTQGYMSRLHACDSRTSIDAVSLNHRPREADRPVPLPYSTNSNIPRSASGYYEPQSARFVAGYAQAEEDEDEDEEISEIPPVHQVSRADNLSEVSLGERSAEEQLRRTFLNQFIGRGGVGGRLSMESESAPKDPAPSSAAASGDQRAAIRRDSLFESKDSMESAASRESVISATSYRAEPRLSRHFNY
uniref:Uncharacterized protein n=1 Tax=Plectus sambesii TaxID=2011161 RepID=A0A914XKG4_9BILA